MTNNIIYIGLDVDDANFHGCALEPSTGEALTFKCRPTVKGLIRQVNKVQKAFPGHQVTLCYEATYIGNTLKRDLHAHNIACDVVAPSSIPQVRGKKIKTDRIDAAQLARFYANGLLTAVSIPDEEQEMDRDLLRSRNKLQDIQSDLRRHIHGLLRRNNRHFKKIMFFPRESLMELAFRGYEPAAVLTCQAQTECTKGNSVSTPSNYDKPRVPGTSSTTRITLVGNGWYMTKPGPSLAIDAGKTLIITMKCGSSREVIMQCTGQGK